MELLLDFENTLVLLIGPINNTTEPSTFLLSWCGCDLAHSPSASWSYQWMANICANDINFLPLKKTKHG